MRDVLLISWSYTHLGPGLSWSMESSKGCVRWRESSGVDTSRRVAVASITCSQYEANRQVKGFRLVRSDVQYLTILFVFEYTFGIIKIETCKILKSYARGGQNLRNIGGAQDSVREPQTDVDYTCFPTRQPFYI
jgi:hypothetical protein